MKNNRRGFQNVISWSLQTRRHSYSTEIHWNSSLNDKPFNNSNKYIVVSFNISPLNPVKCRPTQPIREQCVGCSYLALNTIQVQLIVRSIFAGNTELVKYRLSWEQKLRVLKVNVALKLTEIILNQTTQTIKFEGLFGENVTRPTILLFHLQSMLAHKSKLTW